LNSKGAILYRSGTYWKLNYQDNTGGWCWSQNGGDDLVPPLGRWCAKLCSGDPSQCTPTYPILTKGALEELDADGELGDGKTPTLQMRVCHKEFGVGTLIGWRQLRGGHLRIGDTSGGLASNGCARVQFDGPKGRWNLMLTELTESALPSAARPFSVGDKVTVTADYRNIEDAEDGPLKPGMYGVIVKDDESSKPFEVQCGERSWWYVAKALQKADETIVSSKPANETKSNATIVSGEPASDQVS
jgi:hypothetical protein